MEGGEGVQVVVMVALASAITCCCLLEASRRLSPRLSKAYGRQSAGNRLDWDSRVPSTVHAVLVTVAATWLLASEELGETLADWSGGAHGLDGAAHAPGTHPVLRATPAGHVLLGVSFGYFLYDLLLVLASPPLRSAPIVAHHLLAVATLAIYFKVRAAHPYVLLFMTQEVTTPSINLRWWLDRAERKDSSLYLANALLLLVLWAVWRVALFLPYYWHLALHWGVLSGALPTYAQATLVAVPAVLIVLNAVWFVKLVQGVAKLLGSGSGARGKQRGSSGPFKRRGGKSA